eukprot:TRINITY_DN1590_c1_g1_i1.p1 TRINITY_DN1590_c1_g1~~TRINITY_DN1590_c1_g1_i1.p1  ORF type:complete len:529 (+),score=36.23 TRINITY_DN1590_c1_g1_i1:115-1587(+)
MRPTLLVSRTIWTSSPILNAATQTLLKQFEEMLPGRVTQNSDVLYQHGHDESWHPCMPPEMVVYPESTAEVQQIVKLCSEYRKPIIPFGAGTSLEGHVAALHGGICLDLTNMNQILEVHSEDMDCRVQSGVTRQQLNHYLKEEGLFFPVDPGAHATLGGMVSTRASGTNAVKYGTMRENVLNLQVVTPQGNVMETGRRVKKSSAGYDLTHLYVGSEGTLGIITEIQLKLYPWPEVISAAICEFQNMKGAVDSVVTIMQMGIPVARMELIDDACIRAVNQYSKMTLTECPTLFFEFHGTPASVEEQVQTTSEVVQQLGGAEFKWSSNEEERNNLWKARHNAYYACLASRPGCKGLSTDVCVPISKLTNCILETIDDVKKYGLLAPMVSHAGDGNFHMLLMVDIEDKQEFARAEEFMKQLVHRALQMGGTCTGEHGIGHGKLPYLIEEHGKHVLDTMHQIKQALDPLNIMNPGKIGVEYEKILQMKQKLVRS